MNQFFSSFFKKKEKKKLWIQVVIEMRSQYLPNYRSFAPTIELLTYASFLLEYLLPLTPNSRSVFRAGVSLNINSFIHLPLPPPPPPPPPTLNPHLRLTMQSSRLNARLVVLRLVLPGSPLSRVCVMRTAPVHLPLFTPYEQTT